MADDSDFSAAVAAETFENLGATPAESNGRGVKRSPSPTSLEAAKIAKTTSVQEAVQEAVGTKRSTPSPGDENESPSPLFKKPRRFEDITGLLHGFGFKSDLGSSSGRHGEDGKSVSAQSSGQQSTATVPQESDYNDVGKRNVKVTEGPGVPCYVCG